MFDPEEDAAKVAAVQVPAGNLKRGSGRVPSLDGLRAVSIALVVLGHLSHTPGFPARLSFLEPYANLGVRLFFVISGFLITSLLIAERKKTGSISLVNFYVRRLFRIFPAAYAYILLITWLTRPPLFDSAIALTYATFYFPRVTWDFGHLWSLSVEEQFYLLWPALMCLTFRFSGYFAVAAILISPVLRPLLRIAWPAIGHRGLSGTVDAIAAGCLLALFWTRFVHKTWLKSPWLLLTAPLCVLLLILANYPSASSLSNSFLNVAIAVGMANCVLAEYRWLNGKTICWIGTLSYSLYLWQQPFLSYQDHWYARFPFDVILCFGCACLSYYGVEKPFLSLRESRMQPRAEPATAASIGG